MGIIYRKPGDVEPPDEAPDDHFPAAGEDLEGEEFTTDLAGLKKWLAIQDPNDVPWYDLTSPRQAHLFSLRLTDKQKMQLDCIARLAKTRSAHAWIIAKLAPLLEEEATRLYSMDQINKQLNGEL